MKKLKIAIIGAGSSYTPELIEGFIKRKKELTVDSICFMDINRPKAEIVCALCRRMFEASGMDTRLVFTEDLSEAVRDADYVLGQVRVGGLDARINDEKIPLKYGLLGQETTGVGGFMKAMRTIPVIMDVAHAIEKFAPTAWFINFSNPSGLIAEAVLNNTGVRMIGLCNAPINMLKNAKKLLPGGTKEFSYDFIGLNHLCWITGIYADGRELLNEMIASEDGVNAIEKAFGFTFKPGVLSATRGIPTGYLNYYYYREEQIKKCQEAEKTRGEVCKEIEASLLELYKNPELKTKPVELEKRGGALYSEAAVSLIDAIENDKNEVHVVDVLNRGAYGFMGNNDAVEVKCIVNKDGASPIRYGPFDNMYIIGLMQAVKAYEKLAVKAGLEGDYSAALAALMVHPLIGDYTKAKGALDELLAVNREYLPQFFK